MPHTEGILTERRNYGFHTIMITYLSAKNFVVDLPTWFHFAKVTTVDGRIIIHIPKTFCGLAKVVKLICSDAGTARMRRRITVVQLLLNPLHAQQY